MALRQVQKIQVIEITQVHWRSRPFFKSSDEFQTQKISHLGPGGHDKQTLSLARSLLVHPVDVFLRSRWLYS